MFEDIQEYSEYWSYEWFTQLEGKPDPEKVQEIAVLFLDRCEQGDMNWRWDGLMRRIITLGVPSEDADTRARFLRFVMKPERITRLTDWHFTKLYRTFTEQERAELLVLIDSVARTVPFNHFHLCLRKFYWNVNLGDRAERASIDIEDRTLKSAISD